MIGMTLNAPPWYGVSRPEGRNLRARGGALQHAFSGGCRHVFGSNYDVPRLMSAYNHRLPLDYSRLERLG